ncbi:MAG: hypothetical protein Q9191_002975 [Dirinaria sp. TL-2023a]
MAAHSLAIAKASLAAGMLRPDPVPVSRNEVANFHTLLESVCMRCTPANVQFCKDWLLKNAVSSTARAAAVGKYLIALVSSLADASAVDQRRSTPGKEPSSRRKQLHILYLVNDLLHNTKFHNDLSPFYPTFSHNIQPHLVELFRHASASGGEAYSKHHRKILALIDLWEEKDYYPRAYLDEIRYITRTVPSTGFPVKDGDTGGSNAKAEELNEHQRDSPFILPANHGDISTPFYDLPAGNMMPHIIPNLPAPIKPQLVKPLQFAAGPADEALVAAVKVLMKDIDSLYGKGDWYDDNAIADIDALGQPAIRDELAGETIDGEGYYGWSKAFCEKMQRRRGGEKNSVTHTGRDLSSESSLSPRKRRRYSDSTSRGRSRSPSRSISHSPPRSNSQNWNTASKGQRPSPSRAVSPRQSRGRSDRRRYEDSRSPRRSRQRERSVSRSRSSSIGRSIASSTVLQAQPIRSGNRPSPRPSLPLPAALNGAFPIGPNGLPIPPPPPPNYTGPWPPPPPPLPSSTQRPQSQGNSSHFPTFISPPPAPPPSTRPGPGFGGFGMPALPNVIIGGQDPASMHPEGWPQQQSENHRVPYNGAHYRDGRNR